MALSGPSVGRQSCSARLSAVACPLPSIYLGTSSWEGKFEIKRSKAKVTGNEIAFSRKSSRKIDRFTDLQTPTDARPISYITPNAFL